MQVPAGAVDLPAARPPASPAPSATMPAPAAPPVLSAPPVAPPPPLPSIQSNTGQGKPALPPLPSAEAAASPYRSPQTDITPYRPEPPAAFGNPLLPFARDKFLLRQKLRLIDQKYEIWDEQGQPILYVERPTHFFQSLLAAFGAIATGLIVGGALVIPGALVAKKVSEPVGVVLIILAIALAIAAIAAVGVVLSPKRHVHFYHDASKGQQVLRILQDRKFTPINATYTVLDASGQVIARLHKNYLYNFFRKRWYIYGLDGSVQFMAMEDSVVLSLLRRALGPMYGLLRTNFIIVRGENSEDEIGQFNRKFTLLDRYVLDLSDDPQRTFDRRVALALGLMLDTGERR